MSFELIQVIHRPLCHINRHILANNLIFHVTFIAVLLMSVRKCTYMYDYIRLCTTYYDTMFNNVRQCSTVYAKKYFPTTEFLSHQKVLHLKLFFKFAALPTKT